MEEQQEFLYSERGSNKARVCLVISVYSHYYTCVPLTSTVSSVKYSTSENLHYLLFSSAKEVLNS